MCSLIVIRAFTSLVVLWSVYYSLELAAKAGANQGVIASVFSSSIAFTAIIFYFFYGEKFTARHLIGIPLIGAGVIFISMGKSVGGYK
jgi:drug/metabolite transporter (DMT)-like permease